MPVPGFDGSGNYVRQYSWVTDKTNSVNITASRMDTEDDGFASGLSLALTRDGQGKMAADFTPSSDAAYQLGSVSARWTNLNLSGVANVGGVLTATGGVKVPAADSIARGVAVCRFKSADTSRNSTITYANDPDLQYTIPGAGTYAVNLFLLNPSGAGGFAATMFCVAPFSTSGWLATGVSRGSALTLTGYLAFNGSGFNGGAGAGVADCTIITGQIVTTGSGLLSLQWAQAASNAANTTVKAGSYLTVTQLS